jgi:ABC-type nitrate/sulfonate/bicarbonate transport system substrate-binding protein
MQMKLRLKYLVVVVFVAVVAGIILVAAVKRKEPGGDVAIRVLESTVPSEFEIASALTGKDILKEEGVRLDRINSVESSGGTVSIQALLANNIDYAGSAWPAWINAIASGAKIKAVVSSNATSEVNPGNGLVVLDNSSIRTVKDLVGKRIAVNVLGASADYEIRDYLRQNGLSIDQVQLVVVPSRQIEQVLRSGQVDVAAWTMSGGVDYELAKDHGGLRELPGTRRFDVRGATIIFGSGFRTEFLEKHPQTVIHFINAIERSRRTIWDAYGKDPATVRKVYAEISAQKGGNPQLAKYYKPNFLPTYAYANDRDVQWWIDILTSEGKLKPGQIKPSDVYTHKHNQFYKNSNSDKVSGQ